MLIRKFITTLAALIAFTGAAVANSAYPSTSPSTLAGLAALTQAQSVSGVYQHVYIAPTAFYDYEATSALACPHDYTADSSYVCPSDYDSTGRWLRGPVVPAVAAWPSNERWVVMGSSYDAGYNSQGDVYISASEPGTGYSGTGTVTVNVTSGSCATPPTVNAWVNASGGLQFALTNVGQVCYTAAFSTSISGFSGGSGASVSLTPYANPYTTPWWLSMFNGPPLSGKVVSNLNYAVSGSTVADNITNFGTHSVASLCADSTYHNYFLFDGGAGGNSINAGTDAATIYAQWLTLTHMAKAAGCTVVVSSVPGRNIYGSVSQSVWYQRAQALNALIDGGVQGVDYDYLIDWGSALTNTSAFPYSPFDGTHFTGQGQIYLGQLGSNALASGGRAAGYPNTSFPTGVFTLGLSVAGNSAPYQADGWRFGSLGGTSYLDLTGDGVGLFNALDVRRCDSAAAICNDAFGYDTSGGFFTAGGLRVGAGSTPAVANNSFIVSYFSGTEYITNFSGSGGTKNPLVFRQCDPNSICQTYMGIDASGAATFPTAPIISGSTTDCLMMATGTNSNMSLSPGATSSYGIGACGTIAAGLPTADKNALRVESYGTGGLTLASYGGTSDVRLEPNRVVKWIAAVDGGFYAADATGGSKGNGTINLVSAAYINGASTILTGTAAPATTPAFVGQEFVDTTGKKIYTATGTSSSGDWTVLN